MGEHALWHAFSKRTVTSDEIIYAFERWVQLLDPFG